MVGEEKIIESAMETTAELGAKEIAKQAAVAAADEAVKWGFKEWYVATSSVAGTVGAVALIVWGASKGIKKLAAHIRSKKGIPVAEEIPDVEVKVNDEKKETEMKVEQK